VRRLIILCFLRYGNSVYGRSDEKEKASRDIFTARGKVRKKWKTGCFDKYGLPAGFPNFKNSLGNWGLMSEGYDESVQNAMPENVPYKLAKAKMEMLIRRGLVTVCTCGCRGDFEVTEKGHQWLKDG
jgi:hypothetical protein